MTERNPEMDHGQLEFDEFAESKPKHGKVDFPPDAKLDKPKSEYDPLGQRSNKIDRRYTQD